MCLSESMWHLSFSIWPVSLSMISLRFIHLVANSRISFWMIFLCVCVQLFIHLSFDRQWVFFHFCIFYCEYCCNDHGCENISLGYWCYFLDIVPEVELLDLMVVLGEGNGTPLQYSCLQNPMDRGAPKAAVHGVAEGRTRLSDFTFTFLHWRRTWQPTPVFLPGESQGQGSLVGCRLWGHTELDTTEVT